MVTGTMESLRLPSLPTAWSSEDNFKLLGKLSQATQRNIEPVGAHFLAEARRKRHKRTFSEDERIQAQESVKKTEEDEDGDISENEDALMLERDAKDWKNQDHYAVLGLSKFRFRATPDQIKRAHRKKVLKHHPDKRAALGNSEDDSFFKCIQRATEILQDPVRRRQFDSVDEGADVEPPTKKETKAGGDAKFVKLWGPVFVAEGRFSKITPVPGIGDDTSSKEEVEAFYNFWYNFDSWRSFEYQDEDVPDDNEHRDQKRQVEKKNQNARRKKKTEDTARLRRLVDDALALDYRIAKFKREDKELKNRKRNEAQAEATKAAEDAAKKKVEDDKAAAEREAADKAEKDKGKKTKEAAKNAAKKNKRVVRGAAKDANYFAGAAADPAPAQIDKVLNDVDLVLAVVDPDDLSQLTSKLALEKEPAKVHGLFGEEVARLTAAGKLKDGDASTLRP